MCNCPIMLQPVPDGRTYSEEGLRAVHPKLAALAPLDISHEEQLREARLRADKMSIQGVQPKLSAVLRIGKGAFEIVDRGGRFILKPNPPNYREVPANEALTMRMASAAGIDVPPHGLVGAKDGGWVYFVKRFDREGRSDRVHLEDFAQLSGATRETKYDSSLEQVAAITQTFCTFPALELPKLGKRLLFCFLTGNEDMHLKNFSLWVRNGVVSLSPAYDLLNTTLVLENAKEETALPLRGKKVKLTRPMWLDYFFIERLGLQSRQVEMILEELQAALDPWARLIDSSFLSPDKRRMYRDILADRAKRLRLGR